MTLLHRAMVFVARLMALVGGLVLTSLIILTCVSVIGRGLNSLLHGPIANVAPALSTRLLELGVGPVNGDFELVEAGIAFAIFAFIPLCQVSSGHATVDIFTSRLPPAGKRFLNALIEIVFAIVLVIIAVKLFEGMQSKKRYGETTFLIQFPVWWAYAASLFAAALAAFAGVYMAVVRLGELLTMRTLLPSDAEHAGTES